MHGWGRSSLSVAVAVALAACGGPGHPQVPATPYVPPQPATAADRILPLLPDGAQVVIEIDLARLRANAVVGQVAGRALALLGGDAHVPGLPVAVAGSPLASADAVVLAAYGVGTAQAASITVLATHADVAGGTRLAPDLVALGPPDWIGQLQTRLAIATARGTHLVAPEALLRLRAHAMPAGATGAVLRITARLPFDARVALARQTGLDEPPAELSVWADVADDFALVADADAVAPGDHAGKDAARRLAATIRGVLGAASNSATLQALGVLPSVEDARQITQGSWVRTIVAIGPRHLARVVERARAMLPPP